MFVFIIPMPIYEYHCQHCHHEIERLQKVSDPVLITCPSCEQNSLKRMISAAGFRLSGGGWYETDFKKDKQKNLANTEKSETTKTSEKKD